MSVNRRKTDPDIFTDAVGAHELEANSLREALAYDAYGEQLDFDVIVLSKPIPLNGNDASLMFGTAANPGPNTGQPGMVEGSIAFKGRIVGGPYPSPHLSLPDPCNLAEATDQASAAKIIAMHTTFISTQGSIQQGAFPKVGDRVRVHLLPGDFKFNLQYAYFNKIANSSESAAVAHAMSIGCTTLTGLFSGFDSATDLGALTIQIMGGGTPSPVQYPMRPGSRPTPLQASLISATTPSQFPMKGTISSPFTHYRNGTAVTRPAPHPGLDIANVIGTPIYSALNNGQVSEVVLAPTSTKGFGTRVRVVHTIEGKTITLSYNHLDSVLVAVGDTVQMTTEIAKSGNTGSSTGPHLHWEVFEGGITGRPTLSDGSLDHTRANQRDPIQALNLLSKLQGSRKNRVAPDVAIAAAPAP